MYDVFNALKAILVPYSQALNIKLDEKGHFYLDTHHIMKNEKPLFFGAVRINKTYVSFHLMPVYVNPELLKDITPELKRRMQGKSCFNFKSADEELFEELAQLTKRGFEDYQVKRFLTDD